MPKTTFSATIAIAQTVFEIASQDLEFNELLRDRYEAFLTDQQPDIKIIVNGFKDRSYWLANQRFIDVNEPIRIIDSDSGVTFECCQNPFKARYDKLSKTLTAVLNQSLPLTCFDNLLRALIGILLCPEGGFLLHASAVAAENKAYVFFGKSESGKTTMTRMLAEHTILSDEMIIIKKLDRGYHVFGTPFWGEFYKAAARASGELRKIYLLRKDTVNFAKRLAPKNALRELLACVVFFGHKTGFVRDVFANVAALAKEIEIEELHFNLDQSFCNQLVSEDDHELATVTG